MAGRGAAHGRQRPRPLWHRGCGHGRQRAAFDGRPACPAWSAWPPPISTTAATTWPKKSSASPSAPRAAIRNCSTTKDIDAILIAVPDHWHKQVVVDALAAGKDVYCEKPMSHNPADGLAMVAAQKKTDRIVQIGAQRTSSVLCAKAKELMRTRRNRRPEPD